MEFFTSDTGLCLLWLVIWIGSISLITRKEQNQNKIKKAEKFFNSISEKNK